MDLGSEQLTVWDPSWSVGRGVEGDFRRVGLQGWMGPLWGANAGGWGGFGVDLGQAGRGGRS